MWQETVRAQCTVSAFTCNADTGRADKNRTTDVQDSVGSPQRRFVSGVRPVSAPAPHEPACRAGPAYHTRAASKCASWQFICRASASPRHWPTFAVETEQNHRTPSCDPDSLGQWLSAFRRWVNNLVCSAMKMEALRSFETSVTGVPDK